ncbi:MAG: endonuclease domain-containing protein [Cyclobacteriaceae bacterium]|nr:endonuclease domain-containing protein [Cyclobacteriaceae bacterium]
MHLGAPGQIFDRAQSLRANETKAERLLWERLSKNQLGYKFRRQHPILTYVVDFYCHAKKLVIELDGSVHELVEQRFNDMTRTDALTHYGLKIVRFKNEDVFSDIDKVVRTIESELGRNRN